MASFTQSVDEGVISFEKAIRFLTQRALDKVSDAVTPAFLIDETLQKEAHDVIWEVYDLVDAKYLDARGKAFDRD